MERDDMKNSGIHRRKFLQGAAVGLAGLALPLDRANASFWEAFFQKHYREMSDAEIKEVISRLEREYEVKYKKAVKVGNEKALPGGLPRGLPDLRRRPKSDPLRMPERGDQSQPVFLAIQPFEGLNVHLSRNAQ